LLLLLLSECRLLLRNHEALAALESAVTKGPGATPKKKGRWAKKETTPPPPAAAAAAAAAEGGAADGDANGSSDAAAAAAGDGGDGAAAAAAAPGEELVVAQGNAWRRLLNLIMQLRKVVNHPFMMPDSEPRGDGTSTLQELLDASGGVL
jgi:regulator of protease activity HflC (stomatin/prohibitin superfamily)